jgi:outer membrane cobalamin receptor
MDAYSPAAPNTPSRGRFLPFMFKGTSFSTGGYSAEYGQALSSALVLESKDKAELSRTDFGILSVGGDVGHTHTWDRGSVGGKVQYTNLKPYSSLIDQQVDWIDLPVSLEASAAFRQEVGSDGMFKFYGNISRSDFSLYQHDIDDPDKKKLIELTNDYQYLNGFYRSNINDNWSLRGGVSYTHQNNKISSDSGGLFESTTGVHVKGAVEGSLSDHVELKAGGESITASYREEILWPVTTPMYSFREVISSIFFEIDAYASNQFVMRAGGRVEHNSLSEKLSIDPRISLAYKMGNHGQASIAYGKFRQSVKTDFLKRNNELQAERADHYIINYQFVKGNRTFRIESYFKGYHDLVKYEYGDIRFLTNAGNGDAKGIELFWRDNASISGLDYWISYSYLDTKRKYLDYPHQATPSFASKHNLSVVAKYFVRKIKSQLGVTYSLTSGRPYRDPNIEDFYVLSTPNYADVSVNISYLPTTSIIIYFSCTNLIGRENIFGYEYSTVKSQDGKFNGRAIRQPAPRFLFVGIFVTLSKDKSVNQLPNL